MAYIACSVVGALAVLFILLGIRIDRRIFLRNPTFDKIRESLQKGKVDLFNALRLHSDYEKLDLANTQVGHPTMKLIDLRGARLDELDLTNAKFYRCDLQRAVLLGAKLTESLFKLSSLQHIVANGCDATACILEGVNAQYAQFSRSTLVRAVLIGNFTHASFDRADMRGIRAWTADDRYRSTDMDHVDLRYANLSKGTLSKVSFSGADATEANFTEVDARGAHFRSAMLYKANFTAAVLTKADFNQSKSERATFYKAKLATANLSHTHMMDANFTEADLSGANFRHTRAQSASFFKARLAGADFEGAFLGGADFSGADLENANLRGASLENAKFDEHTKLAGVIWNEASGIPAEAYERSMQETTKTMNLVRASA